MRVVLISNAHVAGQYYCTVSHVSGLYTFVSLQKQSRTIWWFHTRDYFIASVTFNSTFLNAPLWLACIHVCHQASACLQLPNRLPLICQCTD
jgi:hypothetical protein